MLRELLIEDSHQDQDGRELPDTTNQSLTSLTNIEANTDPNRQGLIRHVPGPHLVYKRETPQGDFEELWVYNIEVTKSTADIKRQILDGTDIDSRNTESKDGSQKYTLVTLGNAQLLKINGLPQ